MIRFVMGFSLIMLAACNQNTNEMGGTAFREDVEDRSEDLGGTGNNVDLQRVGFRDTNTNTNIDRDRNSNRDRNVNRERNDNTERNMNTDRSFTRDRNMNITNVGTNTNKNNSRSGSLIVPTDGIQRVGHGFLTIEQNSYSTTTPSKNFPHSKFIKRGQFSFYKETGRDGGQTNTGQQGAQGNQQQQNAAGQQGTEQAPTNDAQQNTQGISAVESKVIELTNAQRRKNGLKDLQADTALSNVARTKSNDMRSKNYFSHTSPTYGSPFDMMRDFGISYKSAGENIAKGQTTPEQVVDAWMNSEGHRKNILSADYTHIGVGYSESGNYWTQMFIKK